MRESVSVLVVDDDVDIREALEQVLAEEGYRVVTAANGHEALERLREVSPRLILLDLSMPVMSGFQFREAQRADAELAKIPTVAMSAGDRLGEKTAGMQLAACLSKPLRLDELLALVGRYCA